MRYPFKVEDIVGWLDPSSNRSLEEFYHYVNGGYLADSSPYRSVDDWHHVSCVYRLKIFKSKTVQALFKDYDEISI
jgi:hypothetical protein